MRHNSRRKEWVASKVFFFSNPRQTCLVGNAFRGIQVFSVKPYQVAKVS